MAEFLEIPNKEETVSRLSQIELMGFKPFEVLEIKANSLILAYEELGRKTARYAKAALKECQQEGNYSEQLKIAKESLKHLRQLAATSTFTTDDGLNHLLRYLETLDGYAKGAGLKSEEAALMQMENAAGCQTLCVANTESGEIVAVHTEEDADVYDQAGNASIGKRWVRIDLPDQKVEYCAYGGLCGYGMASGVISRGGTSLFQAADIIGSTEIGPLWANAACFMLMDCASIEISKKLVSQVLTDFPKGEPIFNGGYVVHQIESGSPPKTQSLEFGGSHLFTLSPLNSGNRQFQFGVNYPQTSELQAIDDYTISEDSGTQKEKKMMERRQRRLSLIASLVGRDQSRESEWGEQRALNLVHRVLQKGRGDILGGWFTGFSNDLVAQNVSVYASPEGKLHLVVRKGYSQASRKMRKSDVAA